MNSTLSKFTVFGILAGLFLTACAGAATPTAEAPPIVVDEFAVIAEGRLVPADYVELSFRTSGQVAEVLVVEGDLVAADQVIGRLADEEQLAAEIDRANLELVNARQALDDLNTNAAKARAEAELEVANAVQAVFDAERRLSGVQYPDVEEYQQTVDEASENLALLEAEQTITDIGGTGAAVQGAADGVELAEERLGAVQTAEQGCGGCDPDRLADAQDAYNGAVNALTTAQLQQQNATISTQQQIRDAEEALQDAQEDLTAALAGPNARQTAIKQAELLVAQTRLDDARRNLDEVADGPDPDLVEAAEARITSAESALDAAQAALERLELRAPFAGTIANLTLKAGEQISAGQAIATLADLSNWVVETDNLTEIDVVKVSLGQGVSVVLDALPDKTLQGEVTAIETVYEEKRGDITYTVDVTLAASDPLARWGMTAEVTFDQ
jgi:multidrug efflux pump subunit AcrA (membrane-fusion protein)